MGLSLTPQQLLLLQLQALTTKLGLPCAITRTLSAITSSLSALTRYGRTLTSYTAGETDHPERLQKHPAHLVFFFEVCHMSSGWFDCTEPSLSTAVQGKQGVQGAYALVRGGSSTSNLFEPTRTTASQS